MCTGVWEGQKRDQLYLGARSVAEALSTHPYTSSLARLFHLGSHFVTKLSSR